MNSIWGIDWPAAAAVVAVGGAVAGLVGWVCRMMLARLFVTHAEHHALTNRVVAVEQGISGAATHAEMANISDRLRPLEVELGRMGERMEGLRQIGARTEHMVSILIENRLAEEQK